ncbi:hypothetical protein ABZ929_11950 [Streptomyces physcomitrii]|uniref:hypothetical protein n=1 Tax=Streptomyces physcomitrii TaxID=2724184 RepID=UPI0033F5EE17
MSDSPDSVAVTPLGAELLVISVPHQGPTSVLSDLPRAAAVRLLRGVANGMEGGPRLGDSGAPACWEPPREEEVPGRGALIRALTAPRHKGPRYSPDSAAYLVDELCEDVRRVTAAVQRSVLEHAERSQLAVSAHALIDLIDPDAEPPGEHRGPSPLSGGEGGEGREAGA